MVRYYIDSTEIKEPIGFDNFEGKIGRHKYHGVTVENSTGELEFEDVAYDIITAAYYNDIDTKLVLKAQIDCGSGYEDIYQGIIDLSTYKNQKSDYCSCFCMVGEIGDKTTFNNRLDTVLDLESTTSMDGATLTALSNLNKTITIPAKEILYRYYKKIVANKSQDITINNPIYPTLYLVPLFEKNVYNEIGATYTDSEVPIYAPIFTSENDAKNVKAIYNVEWARYLTLNQISVYFPFSYTKISGSYADAIGITMILHQNDVPIATSSELVVTTTTTTATFTFNTDLTEEEGNLYSYGVYLKIRKINATNTDPIQIRIGMSSNAYFRIKRLELYNESTAKVSMVHELLSRSTELISGLTVKSEWYGRPDSQIHSTASFGGGALKAVTNGFKLRNTVGIAGQNYNINTSFKNIFESLNAIDNIGYGFSKEDDEEFIRVEKSSWFYKSNIILSIENPSNKKRRLNQDSIFSKLKIGYNKSGSTDDVNSIDTFHTVREYSTKLKSVNNELAVTSDFIADPYAIEFTRRKTEEKSTKQWKYDNDMFVFALGVLDSEYQVEQGVTDTDDTIISPETLINARISPIRNSARWADRLFQIFRAANNPLYFTSGTGNVNAECTPSTAYDDVCENSISGVVKENDNVPYTSPILSCELVTFEYPITLDQWRDLKNNPYDVIVVDQEECYLNEVRYNYNDGLANFSLIPIGY